MPDLGDGSFSWRLEFWDLPENPRAELSKLREQVEGRPDHPGRREIERIEAALAGSPHALKRRLWARDVGHWRLNIDYRLGGYADTAAAGDTLWQLSHSELMIGTEENKPAVETIATQRYSFWPEINRLIFGGLSHGVISGIRPGELTWDGEEWRVPLRFGPADEPSYEAVLVGRWDEGRERGFVERQILLGSAVQPAAVGTEYRYSDWRYVSEMDRWIAGRVEDVSPEGKVLRAYVFESWDPGRDGDFERVLAVPSPDSPDPVRGELTFTRLVDYRRNALREREGAGEQFAETVPLERRGGAWRNWLGWVSAAGLAAGLIALYLHRRMAAR